MADVEDVCHRQPVERDCEQRAVQAERSQTHGLRVNSLTTVPERLLRMATTRQSCANATARNVVVTMASPVQPGRNRQCPRGSHAYEGRPHIPPGHPPSRGSARA